MWFLKSISLLFFAIGAARGGEYKGFGVTALRGGIFFGAYKLSIASDKQPRQTMTSFSKNTKNKRIEVLVIEPPSGKYPQNVLSYVTLKNIQDIHIRWIGFTAEVAESFLKLKCLDNVAKIVIESDITIGEDAIKILSKGKWPQLDTMKLSPVWTHAVLPLLYKKWKQPIRFIVSDSVEDENYVFCENLRDDSLRPENLNAKFLVPNDVSVFTLDNKRKAIPHPSFLSAERESSNFFKQFWNRIAGWVRYS